MLVDGFLPKRKVLKNSFGIVQNKNFFFFFVIDKLWTKMLFFLLLADSLSFYFFSNLCPILVCCVFLFFFLFCIVCYLRPKLLDFFLINVTMLIVVVWRKKHIFVQKFQCVLVTVEFFHTCPKSFNCEKFVSKKTKWIGWFRFYFDFLVFVFFLNYNFFFSLLFLICHCFFWTRKALMLPLRDTLLVYIIYFLELLFSVCCD